MQPGFYDIETEMCTPELDDVKDYIPQEIQSNIVEKRPVCVYITIHYCYFSFLFQSFFRHIFIL